MLLPFLLLKIQIVMESAKYNAAIFDLDGTLYVNKGFPMKLIMGDLRNMFVLSTERKARKKIMGKDYQTESGVYDALFAEMCALKKSLTVQKARAWYEERYMPLQVSVLQLYYEPRPLAVELLEAMKARGMKVILYSDYGHVTEKIAALGIPQSCFDVILSAPEVGGLKPSQASMQRLMECCGVDPATTLYVGDREDTDGESARIAKMDFHNVKGSPDAWDELLKSFL